MYLRSSPQTFYFLVLQLGISIEDRVTFLVVLEVYLSHTYCIGIKEYEFWKKSILLINVFFFKVKTWNYSVFSSLVEHERDVNVWNTRLNVGNDLTRWNSRGYNSFWITADCVKITEQRHNLNWSYQQSLATIAFNWY